ncbi:Nif3-like dinuclear metal center hexameric protein [Streptococcus halichoeri]|uniref:Nif3-like dinuclear metal center hexameric protein n=1 Tax=Streptococcus halichoeri TaxID=254785 RepID=UPI0013590A8E|nr:Nif3-like dinuclear metal center hexameric protein [Streptococcus halichoeri]
MKASDIIERYEAFCPPDLSLEGDSVGLQVGRLTKDVERVMVTLDIREQTVAEAIACGVDLIITKHAPIHKGLKDLVASPRRDIVLSLVKHDIAVYVSHTNIDVVPGGLNDWFCQELGIEEPRPLAETKNGFGLGRIGHIQPQSLEAFAHKIKTVFDLDSIRLVRYGKANPLIETVAICGGSGDKFYPQARDKGADVYVTGDIYYHTAHEMLTDGLVAIDPGHHIEVLFIDGVLRKLEEWKKQEGWSVSFLASQRSTNPFSHLS